MKYSSNKDLNQCIRELVKNGWIYHSKKKHGRLVSLDGRTKITVSKSPSDCNAFRQLQRDIRRILLDNVWFA